ncbi:hypothetical protein L2725_03660 [Shewanella corallii]|uniref:Uncharacterized protein n=1 Tax=Shewanella corallii TaxID=560080 RepID=A0ABT0N351_9GAMM|nr:hypothetical protein [Shewanella corallii]MCL2912881.1 hypothetical protein [Shewanella corallii]
MDAEAATSNHGRAFVALANFRNEPEESSVSVGAAREIQEGIAVDPLLVGFGAKLHDVLPSEAWSSPAAGSLVRSTNNKTDTSVSKYMDTLFSSKKQNQITNMILLRANRALPTPLLGDMQ